jgi:hypothetical protein
MLAIMQFRIFCPPFCYLKYFTCNLWWYGCETWSVTLREEHRLRVLENRVLRRIFENKRDEATAGWSINCIMRSFKICALYQILLG